MKHFSCSSRITPFAAALVIVLGARSASAQLYYDPVVTLIGTPSAPVSGTGYTTSLALYLNSVANQASAQSLVSYNSGATGTRLVNSTTATSEGALSNSPTIANNAALGIQSTGTAYVYSAGYDAASGTASVSAAGTSANRALGQATVGIDTVSNASVIQTQTQATAYSGNNIRGATGNDNGTNLYTAGTGSPTTTAGWRNFVTNAQLGSTVTNTRTVELLAGGLFGTTGSGTVGIYKIDPTGVAAPTAFITTGTSSDHSPYEFALFNNPTNTNSQFGYNIAYIADDKSPTGDTNGGIEKWTYNGTAWSQAYILQDTSTTYYRGLAGELDPTSGQVTLFATTSDGTKLQQVTDSGATASFTTLATAPTNEVFRGVALAPSAVPEPSALASLAAGLGLLGFRRRRNA